jgi:hypothetical protein
MVWEQQGQRRGGKMEIKKQVPSITVNIRVPASIYERLEDEISKMNKNGQKVSKNSLYVEALTQFLDSIEEEQVYQYEEEEFELQPETKVVADEIENITESCSFCDRPDREIKRDIDNDNIPDDALLSRCCWRRISYVRAIFGVTIEWPELCRRRGRLYKSKR